MTRGNTPNPPTQDLKSTIPTHLLIAENIIVAKLDIVLL